MEAYLNPMVDENLDPFGKKSKVHDLVFGEIDLNDSEDSLSSIIVRDLFQDRLGFDQTKVDHMLLPVMESFKKKPAMNQQDLTSLNVKKSVPSKR